MHKNATNLQICNTCGHARPLNGLPDKLSDKDFDLPAVRNLERNLNPFRDNAYGARPVEDVPDWVRQGG